MNYEWNLWHNMKIKTFFTVNLPDIKSGRFPKGKWYSIKHGSEYVAKFLIMKIDPNTLQREFYVTNHLKQPVPIEYCILAEKLQNKINELKVKRKINDHKKLVCL